MTAFDYTGVIPILPTPFHDDDRIDIDGLLSIAALCASVGVQGLTVLGVLGESHALTDAEGDELVQALASADLGVPIVVGASRPGATATRAAIERAAASGADAVMIAPPTVEGISETSVHAYYDAALADSPLPVVVQDHPTSTKVQMSAALLVRLAAELPAVVGLKVEAVPTGPKLRMLREQVPSIRMLTGLGALYAASDLAAGSDGFNTGFAFPELLLELVRRNRQGDLEGVRALYRRFLPLIVFEQQPGPAVRKEVWRVRDRIASARVRAPSAQLSPWAAAELRAILDDTFGEHDLTAALTSFD